MATMKIAFVLAAVLLVERILPVQGLSSPLRSTATTPVSPQVEDNARRQLFTQVPAIVAAAGLGPGAAVVGRPQPCWPAGKATTSTDGNLPDLPNEAVRSYLQYRIPLQIAADYYIFSLQDIIGDPDEWGEASQLFRVNNNKGQGQPSRVERDFVNPMRVLLLSFPPDVSDDMRTEQFKFEKAMDKISKATAGYRRDLPVEIDARTITKAKEGWEEGRVALNGFFALLNEATGLKELKSIPPAGANQYKEYGRSARRFNELTKKTKLCQNRGGPALSQAWGESVVVIGCLQKCLIKQPNPYLTTFQNSFFTFQTNRPANGFGIHARLLWYSRS